MRIAVCDDNKAFLDSIAIKAKMYFETYDIICDVDKYLYGDNLLSAHHAQPYDVVFLDILMPKTSGFDVAKDIRDLSEKTVIVFVTTENQLIQSSLDYRPFHFVYKGNEHAMDIYLKNVIEKLAVFLETSRTVTIELPYREEKRIVIKDIVCVSSKANYLEITLVSGEKTKVRKTLESFTELLPEKHFAKTHSRFLVNMNYIKWIDYPNHTVHLKNNEKITISRRCKNDFSDRYKYFTREVL